VCVDNCARADGGRKIEIGRADIRVIADNGVVAARGVCIARLISEESIGIARSVGAACVATEEGIVVATCGCYTRCRSEKGVVIAHGVLTACAAAKERVIVSDAFSTRLEPKESVVAGRGIRGTRISAEERVAEASSVALPCVSSEERIVEAGRVADPGQEAREQVSRYVVAQDSIAGEVVLSGGINRSCRQRAAHRAVTADVEVACSLGCGGVLNIVRAIGQRISRISHSRISRRDILTCVDTTQL